MKIFNRSKTQELTDCDPAKGRLVNDTLVLVHHDATPAVPAKTAREVAMELQAQGHTVFPPVTEEEEAFLREKEALLAAAGEETGIVAHVEQKYYLVLAEYPNGGRDVQEIKPTEAVPAKEAWDETEDIQVYIPYTEEELAAIEARKAIAEAKAFLEKTDYIVLKIAEAQAEGDAAGVAALQAEYAEQLAARKQARVTVNENQLQFDKTGTVL